MKDKDKRKDQIIKEVTNLRRQISKLEISEAACRYAEGKLRENEKKYRELVESIKDPIFVLNEKGLATYVSPAIEALIGYSASELMGRSFSEFVCKEDLPWIMERFRKPLAHNAEPMECQILTRSKEKIWVRISYRPIFKEKKLNGFQGVVADVTERKQAEEALKQSEIQMRTAMDSMADAIHVIDTDFRVVLFNKTFKKWITELGLESDVVGRNVFDIFPFLSSRVKREYRQVFKTGKALVTEEISEVSGQKFITETRKIPIFEKKKVVRIITVVRDITEPNRADEALRESEKKYKTLTTNVNVGIYRNSIGLKGKFLEANPAVVKMFGYETREEFIAINVVDLYQNPEDRKKFNQKMLRKRFVKDEELRLKKKDGSPFIASVSAVAVKDEKGVVKYYDGIIEDVTERKSAEHELKRSFSKLQRILEETVNALASTLGKRDPYTAGHQERVTKLAYAIAKEMGLSKQRIKGIRLAGLLHDIGKIAVPAEILSKPSRLTDAEFNIVRTHSQVGYEILKKVEFPWSIADIVLQHHELLDGSGYPQGLRASKILLESKIMVVADVVEAMCSHRPYRPAHSLQETLEEVSKYRGILYDAGVVDTCLKLFAEKKFKFE